MTYSNSSYKIDFCYEAVHVVILVVNEFRIINEQENVLKIQFECYLPTHDLVLPPS